MLAFVFAPFFIALEALIYIRAIKHLKQYRIRGKYAIYHAFGMFLLSGVVSILCGFVMSSSNPLKRVFTRFGFYWFGIICYFALALVFALIVRYIIWLIIKDKYNVNKARQYTIVFVVIFAAVISVYGIYHAHKLKINSYEIDVDKSSERESLNVALVADLHIGYNVGLKEIEDMVTKINELNPDIVIIAGDIFDNQYEAVENPEKMAELLRNLKSAYGTYAVLGNHDIDEKILMGFTFAGNGDKVCISDDMMKLLNNSNINVLYDDYIEIDGIQIYGRPDSHKYNLGYDSRLSPVDVVSKLDEDKPIIVIDHEPYELSELADAGVDVDLSGHTHDGQIWPAKYLNYLIWENPVGYLEVNGMHSIVTSGIGLFGPNMRVGTDAEICSIKINFKG